MVGRGKTPRSGELSYTNGLLHATGVLPWRDGPLITAAPEMLFVRDTDGDGRADERKVLFTGFGLGNHQHMVNGLRWGLDNWVHGANGDGGAGAHVVVKSVMTGRDVDIRGRNISAFCLE